MELWEHNWLTFSWELSVPNTLAQVLTEKKKAGLWRMVGRNLSETVKTTSEFSRVMSVKNKSPLEVSVPWSRIKNLPGM